MGPEPITCAGIVLPDCRTGALVDLGVAPPLAVVSLIRHRFCLPCHEHLGRLLERAPEIADLGATLVAAGFSPAAPLARLADHLRWPSMFLADQERILYGRLGLIRARRRDVFNAGTMRIYRDAVRRG